MLEVGKLAGTRLVTMPTKYLTDSVPGKIYHLTIETKGMANEEEAVKVLAIELHEKFKAEVIWARVADGAVDLQLIGSPFAWAALIAFLPTILAVLGVIVVLVSVYGVISAVPGWAWALLAVGAGLILLGPTVSKAVTAGAKEYKVKKTW